MVPREFGHYWLQALIGTGGMGEVYRAHDTRHDRDVAIKLLPEALASDKEYTQRFRRESRVAARLREPHVIPIHDFGEIDGRLYIDMRLVDGHDVGKILESGPMDPARAVYLIGQVADALDAAHDDGLVHRDIKPSNVLLTSNDFVYVVDFGIARSIGTAGTSLTATGAAVGTLDYMAPERFTMSGIDRRTDVYSLTCLLYECLTADRPFKGRDLPSLMYAHLYSDPPRPRDLVQGLPAGLDQVVLRGMAKEPEDRFPTTGALAEAAREALHTAQVAVAPRERVRTTGENSTVVVPRPAAGPDEQRTAVVGGLDSNPISGPVNVGDATVATPWRPGDGHGGTPPPPGPPGAPGSAGEQPPAEGRRRGRTLLVAGAVVALLAVTALVVALLQPFGNGSAGNRAQPGAAPGPAASTGGADPATPAAPSEAPAPSIAVPTVGEEIPIGPTPGYMHLAPNGRFAYIATRDAGVIAVLDTTINRVTATIPIPQGPPQFVSFSPRGDQAFVSVYNKDYTVNLVAFVDTATNTVTKTAPVGKRPFASSTTPDGSLLYVPSHDEGRLDVLDTTTGQTVTTIAVAPNPHWVVFNRDGNLLYMANHESNVVSVLDVATNEVLKEIPVGTSPHSITISPDGSRVSVVNFDSNNVSMIDTATNEVVATVPVGLKPQDIAYAPDGRFFYTANVDDDTVSVVNAATGAVTATINTGDGPTSITVLPNGKRAYVTNLNDGTVRILDITAV